VLIFPLCYSQFEHLEPLVLLDDNVRRWRSNGVMGHILRLTEFLWEVLLIIWGLVGPDPCKLLVALNCFLISLASLCFPLAFQNPVNILHLDSVTLSRYWDCSYKCFMGDPLWNCLQEIREKTFSRWIHCSSFIIPFLESPFSDLSWYAVEKHPKILFL
jgi:hypothetical protein